MGTRKSILGEGCKRSLTNDCFDHLVINELSNERKNDLQKQPNHPSKLDEWSVLLDE